MTLAATFPPPPAWSAWARHSAEPLIGGNRVALLQDGPATFEAMFRAVDGARDHINIESYIVEGGGPGDELAARLAARARAGVKVSLLFDSFGSLWTEAAFFDRLRSAGVTLCEYNPLQRWKLWLGQALHLRNHRKLMVVDGRVGFIGGVNIASVYASGSAPLASGAAAAPEAGAACDRGWRDLHLQVEGPVVQRLQRLFISHWQRHATCALPRARYFPRLMPAGTQRAALAACDAGRRGNPIYKALLSAIGQAGSRVLLTTAYMVPPRRLLRALERAAARGVRVELLLPGVSDSLAALHAGHSHYARLLRAGVHIHERRDTQLHAKACVVDGVWATVGSCNADWRSFVHNAEANLIVVDPAFARQVEQAFADDLACAHRIDPAEWARRPMWQRGVETLARRFEFFL